MKEQIQENVSPPTETPAKFFTLFVDDKEFRVEQEMLTGAEIMAVAGIKAEEGLVLILKDGSQTPVKPTDVVELKPGRRFKKAPRFRRG